MVESSSSKREFFCYKNLTFRWWSCSVASTARSQGVAWFSFALGSGVGGFCFPQTSGDPTSGWWSLMKPTYMQYKTRYPTGGLESPIIFNDIYIINILNITFHWICFFFAVSGWKNLLDDVGHLDEDLNIHGWVEARRKFSMDDWRSKGIFEDFWWLKDWYGSISKKWIIHI